MRFSFSAAAGVFHGLLFLLNAVIVAGSTSSLPSTIITDILYWPVSSPQPSVLSSVSYNPSTLESKILSYTPPDTKSVNPGDDDKSDLVRIGLFTSTPSNPKQWVGSLTSLSYLTRKPTIRLYLGPSNEAYYASLSLSFPSTDTSTPTSHANLEIIPLGAGPLPFLNRPIVVSPDGTNPEEIPEKTLFQK